MENGEARRQWIWNRSLRALLLIRACWGHGGIEGSYQSSVGRLGDFQAASISRVYAVSGTRYASFRGALCASLYLMLVSICHIFFITAAIANQSRHPPCSTARDRQRITTHARVCCRQYQRTQTCAAPASNGSIKCCISQSGATINFPASKIKKPSYRKHHQSHYTVKYQLSHPQASFNEDIDREFSHLRRQGMQIFSRLLPPALSRCRAGTVGH